MKKKIVMTVAALAMAAVVGVSAFAADAVPSVRGGDENTNFIASGQTGSSETAQKTLETLQTKGEEDKRTTEEKLVEVAGTEAVAKAVETAGVESANDLSVRKVGDITAAKDGDASLIVEGVDKDTVVVVMYLGTDGQWHSVKAIYENGRLNFKLPTSGMTTIMVLTQKPAQTKAEA